MKIRLPKQGQKRTRGANRPRKKYRKIIFAAMCQPQHGEEIYSPVLSSEQQEQMLAVMCMTLKMTFFKGGQFLDQKKVLFIFVVAKEKRKDKR